MPKAKRIQKMRLGGYGTKIQSEASWTPMFKSHLMINGDTDSDLRSSQGCNKILKSIATDGSFGAVLLCKSKHIRTDGLSGYACCLITETAIATMRVYRDKNIQNVRMDFEFSALIDIDQILLDVVERLMLKTLDWTYHDRNEEIELIDDQERFDGVNIKRYD